MLLGRQALWSIYSSVKWAILEDLVFTFFLAGVLPVWYIRVLTPEEPILFVLLWKKTQNRCGFTVTPHDSRLQTMLKLLLQPGAVRKRRGCPATLLSEPAGQLAPLFSKSHSAHDEHSLNSEGRPVLLETHKNDLGHNNTTTWLRWCGRNHFLEEWPRLPKGKCSNCRWPFTLPAYILSVFLPLSVGLIFCRYICYFPSLNMEGNGCLWEQGKKKRKKGHFVCSEPGTTFIYSGTSRLPKNTY